MTDNDNADDEPRTERVPSGIDGLDSILQGGFLKGAIYIIQGQPGAGKTIFSNQLCYAHAAAGGKALYVTLLAENHARMLMHMRALAFYDARLVPKALYYISGFSALEDGGLDGLFDLLRREVQGHGATVLILDGLVTAAESAGSALELKKFIHQLQMAAILVDCTIFLLTSDLERPVSPEQPMVDGVIQLSDQPLGDWRVERRLEVKKFRGSDYVRGWHAFRITDKGIEVFPRFEGLFARPTDDRIEDGQQVSTGLARLDGMLCGGLPHGSTTLLVGSQGIGKTTLGLHMLSRCSEAEPGVLLGFYERPHRLLAKSDGLSIGLRPLVEKGVVEMLWQPATEGLLDELGVRLVEVVRRRGVRRIFVDGLAGLMEATAEPERIRRFWTALAHVLWGLDVSTLFITAETDEPVGHVPGVPLSGVSLSDLSNIAENVVLMRFVELRSQLHRVISILKTRDSDFDATLHGFVITREGIVIDESPERAEAILLESAGHRVDDARNARAAGARGEQR